MDTGWIEHRRGRDGELVGWVRPAGEEFVAVDLLGRPRTGPVDWSAAEEALDALGLRYLADPYELRLESGAWVRVRITEVSGERLRLKQEDGGDISSELVSFSLPLPVPEDRLRPLDR